MLYRNYINGKWCDSEEKKDVISPITGETIGQLAMGNAKDVDEAVQGALKAIPVLMNMSTFERAAMLNRIADEMDKRREKLARLLSDEMGKPIGDAMGEVGGSANAFRECAHQIPYIASEIVPCREANRLCLAIKKPIGVFGIITPWNFPLGTPVMYYLAPGLAAGCPMVWNPATSTAAIASAFMECVEAADIPEGALSLVIGRGSVVGHALSVHPDVAGIGFTGSTVTGETICSEAKAKHTLMELGGNGPCIVLKDADLDLTADKIMGGSFANAGQICTSTERVLVDDSIADALVDKIMERMGNYVLGENVGPMHSMETVNIVKEHVADAIAKGAKLLCGGKCDETKPTTHYYEPTVLDHVSADSLLNIEETFGPVLPLIRFKDEAEIPSLVRCSPYRLFAAIFTKDVEKAILMAQEYNFGCVNINDGSNFWDTMLPAGGGGGGASGHGRSGGKYSIQEFMEERAININLQVKNG